MTNPSNSRRFVNAAWSLLVFQLIASVGAVAVTTLAAFHVRDLIGGSERAALPIEQDVAIREAPAAADAAAPPPEAAASPPAAPAAPINQGSGVLTLAQDMRGNINASLFDPDGLTQDARIQWLRNGAPVTGVSGPTYTVSYNDSQSEISARAEYVDGHGFRESVISQPVRIGVIIP